MIISTHTFIVLHRYPRCVLRCSLMFRTKLSFHVSIDLWIASFYSTRYLWILIRVVLRNSYYNISCENFVQKIKFQATVFRNKFNPYYPFRDRFFLKFGNMYFIWRRGMTLAVYKEPDFGIADVTNIRALIFILRRMYEIKRRRYSSSIYCKRSDRFDGSNTNCHYRRALGLFYKNWVEEQITQHNSYLLTVKYFRLI